MRYGFVIDQDRCIGCHACTVACKQEHNVPLGVFRTWVKYIEKGSFPDTTRHFGVMRCNHCDNAPCIDICPTTALFRRDDGIVDFDGSRCIGCKSCMQACPYDAIYMDPNTDTAAKCNFCAHRVELELEPACVIVCPTQAIITGDLDDPKSAVSRIVATRDVSSRKPHKGTQPKLFYVGIHGDLLNPSAMAPQQSHLWAEKPHDDVFYAGASGVGSSHSSEQSRVVYDVDHPAPWGWKIAAYLWTKSISAGVLLIAAVLIAFGYDAGAPVLSTVAAAVALMFAVLTALLLIIDLKRPLRCFYLLTKPNPRSWVVIGAYILGLYGALAFLWLVSGYVGGGVPQVLAYATATVAVACACYSAFLFAQAKGRELWQSPLFFWHLLLQAAVAGAASLSIMAALVPGGASLLPVLGRVLAISLGVWLAMIMAEFALPAINEDVKQAVELMTRGALSWRFWAGAVVAGMLIPIALVLIAEAAGLGAPARVAGSVLALAGVVVFEDLWLKAGQAPALS
jgi:Fe-S-cluster-containing dehydrogenase component/formate-dependent nitrite reductase membrane component NrfD